MLRADTDTQNEQGTVNKQPNRYDVSAVYTHPDAKVDIVLVHGLNGEPKRTWTAKDSAVYWPADLLPASLKGRHANILVYGYNADVYSNRKDKYDRPPKLPPSRHVNLMFLFLPLSLPC